MMDNQDNFNKIYREWMEEELKCVDLEAEKKAFIKEHFDVKPPLVWLTPALSFSAVAVVILGFAFLFNFGPFGQKALAPNNLQVISVEGQPSNKPVPLPLEQPVVFENVSAGISEETLAAIKMATEQGNPGVKVNKVSSKVGSVMVYQKTYQEAPITIVWVFPNATPTAAG